MQTAPLAWVPCMPCVHWDCSDHRKQTKLRACEGNWRWAAPVRMQAAPLACVPCEHRAPLDYGLQEKKGLLSGRLAASFALAPLKDWMQELGQSM
eukprot:1159167-Pelagomonas_calceolata.AAC.4